MTGIDHDLLSHAAARQQATDPVAHIPGATRAYFSDDARALQTKDVTGTRWRRIKPGTLQQIGTVETCGRHTDANLPDIACRARPFTPLHLPFDALQCLHAASIVNTTPACSAGLFYALSPDSTGTQRSK